MPEQAAAPEHPRGSGTDLFSHRPPWELGDAGVLAPTPPDLDVAATLDDLSGSHAAIGAGSHAAIGAASSPSVVLLPHAPGQFEHFHTVDWLRPSASVQVETDSSDTLEQAQTGAAIGASLVEVGSIDVVPDAPQREAAPGQPDAWVEGAPAEVGGVLAPTPQELEELEYLLRAPTSAAEELEDLRAHGAWLPFQQLVQEAIKGQARQALSHHTTTSCRAGHAVGTCGSLKECGADVVRGTPGQWICKIAVPNLLWPGDGIRLEVASPPQSSFKTAQRMTFIEILAYTFFRGPELFRAHTNQWDMGKFQGVKVAARNLRNALGPRPHGRQWNRISDGDGTPSELRASAPKRAADYYQPPGEGDDVAARDERILAALRRLPHGVRQKGPCPRHVYEVLRVEVAPGGLLDLLKRFPDEFGIESERPLLWWRK